ncbi:DUF6787 family protein [Salegentibacter echinorum]|uniref:DUF6787 family protein n=1 Tax=Salegentibacter echinorum TaxID=1073325 RepID=UPI00093290E0|nr:DUF6787 family protein [Salegentibacter echinorum]
MEKLKKRWGIKSNFQIFIIILVFAITGSTAAKLAAPVCNFLGIHQETSHWALYWSVRILLIFPLYQVLLVSFGWVFGQFKFFWAFQKKTLGRLGLSKLFQN